MAKSKFKLLMYCIATMKHFRHAFVGVITLIAISATTAHTQVNGIAYSIFKPGDVPIDPLLNDANSLGIEVGLKFKSIVNGTIYGIRFYKGSGSSDGHVGNIWTAGGSLLATVSFSSQTSSGWQEALLSEPLTITANVTYIVSYFSPSGDYANSDSYFETEPKITHELEAVMHGGGDGPNSVYKYTNSSVFPDQGSSGSNYFVDVVFAAGAGQIGSDYVVKYISPTTIGKSIIFDNGTSVGIGTIDIGSSEYKLYVQTGIRTRRVKVDQSNWPDYVFDTKYSLPPLKEIEAFIHKNKHLPEIPSAREVEEKGLDLGDQQARLLKKIEEMTLYIISMNKEIETLKKETEDLKLQIKKAGR